MKYELAPRLNDGKAEAPPVAVVADNFEGVIEALFDYLPIEMTNDYDEPFGPGFTLTITRIE